MSIARCITFGDFAKGITAYKTTGKKISSNRTRCRTVRYGAFIIKPNKTASILCRSMSIARCRTVRYGGGSFFIPPDETAGIITRSSGSSRCRTVC